LSAGKLDETDVTIEYSAELGRFSLTPCFTYYEYPGSDGESDYGEFCFKLVYTAGIVSVYSSHCVPALTESANGAYYSELGISFEEKLSETALLGGNLGAGFGSRKFNSFNIDYDDSALNNLTAELSLTYDLWGMYFKPHVNCFSVPDSSMRDLLPAAERDVLSAGIAAGVEF